MIPVEYDLFCTIGKTIYFFNSGLPKEELVDEDGHICIAPCDVLDWMEAKIGHDGITHWGHFDEIRLMKGRNRPPVSKDSSSEEHLNEATTGVAAMTVKEEDGAK